MPVYGKDFTYSGEYLLIDDNDNNWRIKFLTSGNFTPLTDMVIDVFLVGGGGGGLIYYSRSGSYSYLGGGGGYTKTVKSIVLAINTEYQIIIGDGGTGGSINVNDAVANRKYATAGGSSSGFNNSVAGGENANNSAINCGNGGSGGGTTSGGIDGSDGVVSSGEYASAGKGQGNTTREFGESTGDLYSSGGDSGSYPNNKDKDPNTGDGGDCSNAGGSGIVIIRNHRE